MVRINVLENNKGVPGHRVFDVMLSPLNSRWPGSPSGVLLSISALVTHLTYWH